MTSGKTVPLRINTSRHALNVPGRAFHVLGWHLRIGGTFPQDALPGAPATEGPVGMAQVHLARGTRWALEPH